MVLFLPAEDLIGSTFSLLQGTMCEAGFRWVRGLTGPQQMATSLLKTLSQRRCAWWAIGISHLGERICVPSLHLTAKQLLLQLLHLFAKDHRQLSQQLRHQICVQQKRVGLGASKVCDQDVGIPSRPKDLTREAVEEKGHLRWPKGLLEVEIHRGGDSSTQLPHGTQLLLWQSWLEAEILDARQGHCNYAVACRETALRASQIQKTVR